MRTTLSLSSRNRLLTQSCPFIDRVAKEVGTFGELGGQVRPFPSNCVLRRALMLDCLCPFQAVVKNVEGVWKDLTDNVNLMASNLTTQVRSIAVVYVSLPAHR